MDSENWGQALLLTSDSAFLIHMEKDDQFDLILQEWI
jgi:hypothetical protein